MSDFFIPEGRPPYVPPVFDFMGKLPARAVIWRDLLYQLLFSVYDIRYPQGWLPSPFRYLLFGYGSLGVVYTEELGWVYGIPGVEKVDWQYTPVSFNLSLFGNAGQAESLPFEGIRGVNGAVIHVRDDWKGFDAMLIQYAKQLADLDRGLDLNARQLRYGKIIGASDKKEADTIRQALKNSEDGDPVVFAAKSLMGTDGRFLISNLMGDVSREYMGDKILETRLMILKDFLTRIGVRTVGMEKREHLLNQEIAENNDETGASPYCVITSLKPDLELLHRMGCSLEIRERYDYGGAGKKEDAEYEE